MIFSTKIRTREVNYLAAPVFTPPKHVSLRDKKVKNCNSLARTAAAPPTYSPHKNHQQDEWDREYDIGEGCSSPAAFSAKHLTKTTAFENKKHTTVLFPMIEFTGSPTTKTHRKS